MGPIGRILAGMVLSSQLLGLIPYEEALTLAGKIGLMMMIFGGGLRIHFLLFRIDGNFRNEKIDEIETTRKFSNFFFVVILL